MPNRKAAAATRGGARNARAQQLSDEAALQQAVAQEVKQETSEDDPLPGLVEGETRVHQRVGIASTEPADEETPAEVTMYRVDRDAKDGQFHTSELKVAAGDVESHKRMGWTETPQ